MAIVFADTGNPVVHASHAPGLTPALMQTSDFWDRAPAVELRGFGGRAAQKTEARALWNDDWLFFSLACADGAIVSPGDKDGLDHFRLGDTAEVFVAQRGDPAYAEIHATPAGRKTAYFCRGYRQPSDPPREAEKIVVAASKTPPGWRSFIALPRGIFGKSENEKGYDVFFARYDYDSADSKPSLSSFPAQRGEKADFHRRSDYAILQLKP